MIYELRTYTLVPGMQAQYLKLNAEVGRKIRGDTYGVLQGAWTTEFATLNQYVHLWGYADLGERDRLRGGAGQERGVGEGLCLADPPHDPGPGEQDPLRRPAPAAARGRAAISTSCAGTGRRRAGPGNGSTTSRPSSPCERSTRAAWGSGRRRWASSTRSCTCGPTAISTSAPPSARSSARIPSGRPSSPRPPRSSPTCSPRSHSDHRLTDEVTEPMSEVNAGAAAQSQATLPRAESRGATAPPGPPERSGGMGGPLEAPHHIVEVGYGGNERLMMNMGPQHPSAHGVFRAILTLEGETVVAVDAVIGYLHRCHEKLAETLTYVQYPSIASKTDYVAAMTAELAYVSAVEKVGAIEVPRRAQYLRVIAAELQRVASHCLWLGTWCMDMGGALGGGATIFLYCLRERETILDLFEALTGARLLYGFHQIGGVRYDVPPGWAEPRAADAQGDRGAHRRVRGHAGGQRLLRDAHPGRGRDLPRPRPRGRDRRAAPARVGGGLRRAARRAVLVVSGLRLQDPRGDRGRLPCALPRAHGGVPRVHQDRPAGPRLACPRAPSPLGQG